MKKFSLLSLVFLLFLVMTQLLTAGELKFKSKNQNETQKNPAYEIKTSFPQLDGYTDKNIQKKFNSKITELINEDIKAFKEDMKNYKNDSNLPNGSYLSTTHEIINKTFPLISVSFMTEGYYSGAAHPFHNLWTVNYDLKSGKLLTLGDLFKKKSNYLKIISDYCIEELTKKETDMLKGTGEKPDTDWIKQGAGPKEENFKSFIITKDSIKIYFNEYQVTNYAMGIQDVTIPLSNLKDIIEPNSIIGK